MVLSGELHVTDEELREYIRQQSELYEQDQGTADVRNHFDARVVARVALHPRHDTVPDSNTGRRHRGTKDEKVRIYLSFPTTGDTISLRVHPELRMGPPDTKPEAAEEKAQEIHRRKTLVGTSSQISKLKAKLWPKKKGGSGDTSYKGQAFTDLMGTVQTRQSVSAAMFKDKRMSLSKKVTPEGDRAWTSRPPPEEEDSLKEQIYRLTGLLPSEQRIFYNRCHLTQNYSNLRDYGIGHGDTLLVMQPLQCSPVYHGEKTKNKINLKEMCPMNKPRKGFRFMPRWQTHTHPRLLEAEATAVTNTAADSVYVFDYSCIPDHGHTDFCGKIRRMHQIT
eukprot:gnl/MRDRNA2_/MRDRNA2_115601_c0_seq1.p1 gnl/MRDRNA2_/MRDRNA2_115601_c0~~gnl/MRDRNA2_/MRDRNA2_115601_c0_seq1.p1  ORF type:complete len:335 (-),score=49.76 gnl/MRDRNA2_/MRDRNA2_115601_c0_seq1:24-1028(-)